MMNRMWEQIEKQPVQSIYVVSGTETFLIDRTIEKIQQRVKQNGEYEEFHFDLEETAIEDVIQEADTIPFFAETKCIVAKNPYFLKAVDKQNDKELHNVETFMEWLDQPSPFSTLILIAPYEKVDERKKIVKRLKTVAEWITCESIEGQDLKVWIQMQFAEGEFDIDADVPEEIIRLLGNDLQKMAIEIKKIKTFAYENKKITSQMVIDLIPKTLEQDIFKLMNAYTTNDLQSCLEIYRDLLQMKEDPIAICALLASNIRTSIHVSYLRKKGYAAPQIAKQLKVHPYRIKLLLESKSPSDAFLLKTLHDLATVDYQLKSTSSQREKLLELFFIRNIGHEKTSANR